jgi:hypothetical protein
LPAKNVREIKVAKYGVAISERAESAVGACFDISAVNDWYNYG